MSDVGGDRVQTVVFMRHGVAQHNVFDERTGKRPNLQDPYFFDPPLTVRGKLGSVQAGEALRVWFKTTQLNEVPQLVVTSPLTRCLQTAVLALGVPDSYEDDALPIACVEHVREAHGIHYPDQRRSKSLLQSYWPMVMFDDSMTEDDELWKPHERETLESLQERIGAFVSWLVGQPHDRVVVVTHGVFMECCLECLCPGSLGGKRVYNCDAYACEVQSTHGTFVAMNNVKHIETTTSSSSPSGG